MLAALMMGCGPPWQIVRQATPDPFLGKKNFVVLPINFTGLRVGEKDEAGYLAEKGEDTKRSFAGDKEGINGEFVKGLQSEANDGGIQVAPSANPAAAEFVIRPIVQWLEPGYYIGISSGASTVKMTVQITTPDGSVLDEILLQHSTPGSLTNAAVGTRLRQDGEDLGKYLGKYLIFRSTGKT
jgi:hypothetical protein